MAGRPIWKTRSEYTERLGISRGHIYLSTMAVYFENVIDVLEVAFTVVYRQSFIHEDFVAESHNSCTCT